PIAACGLRVLAQLMLLWPVLVWLAGTGARCQTAAGDGDGMENVYFVALITLTALRFWFIGAWPVIAFTLVEVPLAVLLLRLNAARARASELVLLTADGARVIRTDWRGRRQESRVA